MIYFIQAGDDGPIKIGVTRNIELRLTRLQTDSPVKLKVIATFKGGSKVEKMLHERFAKYRLEGEWFEPHSDIFKFIETGTLSELPLDKPELPYIQEAIEDEKAVKVIFMGRKGTHKPIEVTSKPTPYLKEIAKLCGESIKGNRTISTLGVPLETVDPSRALTISWAVMGLLGLRAEKAGQIDLAKEFNGICSALARINKRLGEIDLE